MRNYKSRAFTLAEVLITLGIIGIVAAMTIPTLVNNYQQKVLDNQFKKAYALINQGLTNVRGQFDYLPRCYYKDVGGYLDTDCQEVYNKFIASFKVTKYCKNKAYELGCIPEYEGLDTVVNANKPEAEIPDGYESIGDYESRGCTYFRKRAILNVRSVYVLSDGIILIPYSIDFPAIIAVDINGKKGPNKWGYDLFSFMIVTDGNYYKFMGGGCMEAEKGGKTSVQMIEEILK